MGDILYHMTPNRAYERYYHELQVIMDKISSNTQDVHGMLALVGI